MARAFVPDPDIVRLLEAARIRSARAQHDWLSEADRDARHLRSIEAWGSHIEVWNSSSGERIGRVSLLGLDGSLSPDNLKSVLAILADDNVTSAHVRMLECAANRDMTGLLRAAGFQSKSRGVHWVVPTNVPTTAADGFDIRRIGPGELEDFARIIAINYRYKQGMDLAPLIHESTEPNKVCFMGYLEGVPVATGRLSRTDSMCGFGYGTTLKAYRGRGIQQAMIAARVRCARELGCAFATASTMGYDRSSRNLARQGFVKAYEVLVFESQT